jgi:hypothetical protein
MKQSKTNLNKNLEYLKELIVLNNFEKSGPIIQQSATQILDVFGRINFSNENIYRHVIILNEANDMIKSNFSAILDKNDFLSICVHLTCIRRTLQTIHEIVDSNFSNFNISIFPLILY